MFKKIKKLLAPLKIITKNEKGAIVSALLITAILAVSAFTVGVSVYSGWTDLKAWLGEAGLGVLKAILSLLY